MSGGHQATKTLRICFNKQYRALFPTGVKYCRRKSVPFLMGEIKTVLSRFPHISMLNFHDDTFNADKTWLKDFCRQYAADIALPFECSLEANLTDQEVDSYFEKSVIDQPTLKRAQLERFHLLFPFLVKHGFLYRLLKAGNSTLVTKVLSTSVKVLRRLKKLARRTALEA